MKKKIVFLLFNPLDNRNYERFGLSYFEKNGWDIECWVFHNKLFGKNIYVNKNYIYLIKNLFDFFKYLKRLPEKFLFVDLSKRDSLSFLLQRLMIFKGGKRVVITITNYPMVRNASVKTFLFQKFSIKNLIFLIKKLGRIFITITLDNKLCPPPNYHFVCGTEAYKEAAKLSKKTEIIKAHCLNYDNYLLLKNKHPNEQYSDSIVYLDQDYEGNYTYSIEGEVHPVTKEAHWNSLNLFFEKLSKKFNKKIIIAAHPRRDRNVKINTPHEVIFEETANLIKNSFLIIGHDSISLEYAIMFDKPVMFVTTNEIEKDKQSMWIKLFAEEFGKKPINIDNAIDLDDKKILSFDKKVYNNYLEKYIKTPDSSNDNFWNNFINFFENKI